MRIEVLVPDLADLPGELVRPQPAVHRRHMPSRLPIHHHRHRPVRIPPQGLLPLGRIDPHHVLVPRQRLLPGPPPPIAVHLDAPPRLPAERQPPRNILMIEIGISRLPERLHPRLRVIPDEVVRRPALPRRLPPLLPVPLLVMLRVRSPPPEVLPEPV